MTSVFLTEFAEFLESVILSTDPLLITGHFNIHVDAADNVDAIKRLELFQSTGLEQHFNVPTLVGGHTLDLIVTRQSKRIISSAPHADYLFSDHTAVLCELQVDKVILDKSQVSYRKIKSVDLDTLKDELFNSHLCQNSHSLGLSDLINCYNEAQSSALDRHAPLITETVLKRPTFPWFDDDVKSAKRFLQYKSLKSSTVLL